MSVLTLEGVGYRAGRTEILQGVDLDVRDGEWHVLIGPNGAGKSTVFDVISGRQHAQTGRIVFDGHELRGLPPHAIRRRGLARAFQMSSLFDGLSVAQNLRIAALGAAHAHGGSDTLWQRVANRVDLAGETARLLDAIGLAAEREVRAAALPYAQRRLLELGIAFAGAPSLVLLDEPTAGMTRDEARHTVEMLRALAHETTLLIVEHDMSVVFEVAHRISVLAQGTVIATGAPDAIRANPHVHRVYAGAFDEAPR
ncbi:ABC transporter ATP-binding protein [Pararobbsia silviterrae]|uniref:ATP-binding cassette domain-containing protein n=1 Tax=Pararobbsia silviterrae TaxID=1792498 RepID=A0A494XGS0_9BURK|nr:ATP-binding cassette domain-containing protein [Pararobbsia silviterrae]RKP49738.1 ATP-binding cassette domain-containing protein [Pararobbsia silviterrae]